MSAAPHLSGPEAVLLCAVRLREEVDLVHARQRARRTAELLGFETRDQARIAAAVSEITRNALRHAGGGRAEFLFPVGEPPALLVRISDHGAGPSSIEAALNGPPRGSGLAAARRLMDGFHVAARPDGKTGSAVELLRRLPAGAPRPEAGSIAATLHAEAGANDQSEAIRAFAEQDATLLHSLDELQRRADEQQRLNRELEDTNRGVVALHAELEANAEALRQASEMKSRFLSSISHELRTPLNSILALSRLLLDRADGPLVAEQEKQVALIRRSAGTLLELVNDLLDLAKVESGRVDLHAEPFSAAELFGALRAALRPLLPEHGPVALVFEEPASGLPPLHTDQGKVAQVLRNLVSNAIRFTERGEVRGTAQYDAATDTYRFAVADTGIGIAPADQGVIFEEFAQLDSPLQRRGKGTGLGLPLSRRLAELLGGRLDVESSLGHGARFTLCIPRLLAGAAPPAGPPATMPDEPDRPRVLVVDVDEGFRYALRQMIDPALFAVAEAAGAAEALAALRGAAPPALLLLDLDAPQGAALLRDLATLPAPPPVVGVSHAARAAAPRPAPVRAVLSERDLSRPGVTAALRDAAAAAGNGSTAPAGEGLMGDGI